MIRTIGRPRVDLTDKELLARVVEGDQGAFEELVRRHEKALVRWVWALLGDEEEARDVAQETFIKAYTHASRFNPRFGFKTWLYTIARNRAISVLRKRGRQATDIGIPARGEEGSAPKAEDDWISLAADDSPDPREVTSAKEQAEWLRRALDRLDEPHREVLRLKYFGDMKSQEIADLMGLEVGTVWSRVHHGLRKLKALAEELGHGR